MWRFVRATAVVAGLAGGAATAQEPPPSQRYETCRNTAATEERVRGICSAADEVAQQTVTWDALRHPSDHARAQLALGSALLAIGSAGREEAALRASVAAFRRAADYYDRPNTQVRWAGTMLGIGAALNGLARLGDTEANAEAISNLGSAIEATRRAHQPELWASLHVNRGDAFTIRWRSTGNAQDADQAIAAYERALEVFSWSRFADRRPAVEARLADLRRDIAAAALGAGQ